MGYDLAGALSRRAEGRVEVSPAWTRIGRRAFLGCLAGGAATMLGAREARAGQALPDLPFWRRDDLALQAYLYGYAPVAMWATERIQTAVPDTSIYGKAPINQFAYSTASVDPKETTVIRPNVDTLYTGGWLDLSGQPMVLRLPEVPDRYYVVPFLDAYSNEFASLGSRTTGNDPGDYLIAGPHWSGTIPSGIAGVVRCPTPTVWILARTLLRGPDDLDAAVAVELQYQLVPLNRYGTIYTAPINVHFRLPDFDFVPPTGLPVTSAPGFQSGEFFQAMKKFIRKNQPPRAQWPLVNSFQPIIAQPDALTPSVVEAAQAAMNAALAAAGSSVNGWSYSLDVGSYGENYALRAAAAGTGFGATIKEDAVYANCSTSGDGLLLSGSNTYTIDFPAGQQPPVSGFWSITAYNQKILLVENSINRYNVGSETGLVQNADGSLTIYLQSEDKVLPPDAPQANWLPVPRDEQFYLTLRMYWPLGPVLSGQYQIPAVVTT